MSELTLHRTVVDGISIAWTRHTPRDDTGHAGSSVVFLHGLGSSSREFHYLADHPALRDRSLFFLDAPGHGTSDRPADWTYSIEDHADLLARAIERIASPPVVLAGHSMGGSIAIAIAARHPGTASRLIVAEPNLDPGTGTLSGHIARQSEARFVSRGYRALVYQTEREAARGESVASRFLDTLRLSSPIALHRSGVSLRAYRSPTLRDLLERLQIPRTVIWGGKTLPLTPPLANPAIRHELIPGAGHVMMIENPEGFADAIGRALMEEYSRSEGA